MREFVHKRRNGVVITRQFWCKWESPKIQPIDCYPSTFFILPGLWFWRRPGYCYEICFSWLGLIVRYHRIRQERVEYNLFGHKKG